MSKASEGNGDLSRGVESSNQDKTERRSSSVLSSASSSQSVASATVHHDGNHAGKVQAKGDGPCDTDGVTTVTKAVSAASLASSSEVSGPTAAASSNNQPYPAPIQPAGQTISTITPTPSHSTAHNLQSERRNFRSHYYEKVGFRCVEEKKSLDRILAVTDKPIDKEFLHNFCLRFSVPTIHRSKVWRLFLGILPLYNSIENFVWNQRVAQYEDLCTSFKITRRVVLKQAETLADIEVTSAETMAILWLIDNKRLKFGIVNQLRETEVVNFVAIVNSLSKILESPPEVYWVAKGLHYFLQKQLTKRLPACREALAKIFKDDTEMLKHLESHCLLPELCSSALLGSGLATIFSPSILIKLWDRVLAGSSRILIYTLAAAIQHFRLDVLMTMSGQEVSRILKRMTESDQDAVLSEGIDNWEMEGYPVSVGSHPHDHQDVGGIAGAVGQDPAGMVDSRRISSLSLGAGNSCINDRISNEINVIM